MDCNTIVSSGLVAKLAWLEKLYTTILYSTGVKVVVNTTVGQLGAVGIRPYYQAAGRTQ